MKEHYNQVLGIICLFLVIVAMADYIGNEVSTEKKSYSYESDSEEQPTYCINFKYNRNDKSVGDGVVCGGESSKMEASK